MDKEERAEEMSDVAEKTAEVDRLLAQAKKLSAELVATVNLLNSVVVTKESKDGN
jgi:hypothetical protein